MSLKKIYVIAGPTASGKSKLALQIAQKIKGCVVNADAMQIYQDLSVLSARPTELEMQGIPHFLYGYADAYYNGTVQDWLKKAVEVLEKEENPVLVGGTGMYINALVEGLSPIPDVDLDVRTRVRAMPLDEVKALVKECDAIDEQRLKRALEVQLSTGKPLSYFQKLPKIQLIKADFEVVFLNPPREKLYEQCNRRFVQMLDKGAISEVKHLIQIRATGGVVNAIGVPEIISYLSNNYSYDKMIAQAQQATRHYAKRQITWFKHQLNCAKELTDLNDFVYTK